MSDSDDLRLEVLQFDRPREQLAESAAEFASAYSRPLGKAAQATTGQELGDRLRKLKEESAGFGPVPEVLQLDEAVLNEQGITLDARLRQLLRGSDFYWVTFAVTLFPKVDWQFDRLECQIEFTSPTADRARNPVAFDIYPEDDWDTLLQVNMNLEVGVTEALGFACRMPANAANLSAEALAKVAAKASFVLPPRDYRLRRAKVLSRGRGNSEVFWRLYDTAYLENHEPQFGVLLKAPIGNRPVRARGTLAAYRSAKFWTATLGALLTDLPERLRSWFTAGTPLYGHGDWTLVRGQ